MHRVAAEREALSESREPLAALDLVVCNYIDVYTCNSRIKIAVQHHVKQTCTCWGYPARESTYISQLIRIPQGWETVHHMLK